MVLLVLLALAFAATVVMFARRRHRLALWQRELEHAFGSPDVRGIPQPRSLMPRQLTHNG